MFRPVETRSDLLKHVSPFSPLPLHPLPLLLLPLFPFLWGGKGRGREGEGGGGRNEPPPRPPGRGGDEVPPPSGFYKNFFLSKSSNLQNLCNLH